MVTEIWDYVNKLFRKWRSDAEGRGITLPEAQYLAVDPDLEDKEYHHLTLTSDGKLRTDDPTTQAKIDEALAILESATYGNEALKNAIAAAVMLIFEDATSGLDALEALLGAIPTTPELEASADTRYDALIAAITAIPSGVDWSALTPYDVDGRAGIDVYETIINVSGAGYLTGVTLVNPYDGSRTSGIKITIDGSLLNEWRYMGTYGDRQLSYLHRFDSSLKVEAKCDYTWAYAIVAYVLE